MKKYYLDRKFDGFLDKLWVKKGIDLLLKRSSLIKGIVVDLGGGESPYKNLFLNDKINYYTCDMKRNRSVDFVLNLDFKLPIKSKKIDLILITQVLEHVEDPLFTLSEIRRVLSSDGRVFLTVPSFFRLHEVPYDFHRFTFYGLKLLLKKARFSSFEIWGHGDELTVFEESMVFAIRKLKLPKKILLFFIALVNTIFSIREYRKMPVMNPKNDVIGFSAIARK